MREREQAEAVKLLREWLEFEAAADAAASVDAVGAMLAQRTALIERTKKLLTLGGPESHGQRRG